MKRDAELRRDVELEMEWDKSIDARQIGVAVQDGIVTLTGEVHSYVEKWNAERAAERVAGVRGVANDIEVRLTTEHSDTDIAKAAVNALSLNSEVPADQIKVEVSNKGWLTLRGEVNYDYQRRAAERAVRYLPGLRGVSNFITVKPRVAPPDIKSKIEETFRRQALVDAAHITVQVNDGEVILRGTVRSWAERRDAEKAASTAPGVRSVVNLITVDSELAAA